jgi:hypothetical protein
VNEEKGDSKAKECNVIIDRNRKRKKYRDDMGQGNKRPVLFETC